MEEENMIRKIIKINEQLCNGCGACANACHEGAIGMRNGKAVLLRDDYCDGLGNCLPVCPTNAISFEEREALPFDEEAVKENMKTACRCPGEQNKKISHATKQEMADIIESRLNQWPVQIKLVAENASYFSGADLLIAADCTAYAYGDFHREFIEGKITLIGCPKLDMVGYTEKLTTIFSYHDIKSVTVTRMEVPCCGGIEYAVKTAIENSGKNIPFKVVTITIDGKVK